MDLLCKFDYTYWSLVIMLNLYMIYIFNYYIDFILIYLIFNIIWIYTDILIYI